MRATDSSVIARYLSLRSSETGSVVDVVGGAGDVSGQDEVHLVLRHPPHLHRRRSRIDGVRRLRGHRLGRLRGREHRNRPCRLLLDLGFYQSGELWILGFLARYMRTTRAGRPTPMFPPPPSMTRPSRVKLLLELLLRSGLPSTAGFLKKKKKINCRQMWTPPPSRRVVSSARATLLLRLLLLAGAADAAPPLVGVSPQGERAAHISAYLRILFRLYSSPSRSPR